MFGVFQVWYFFVLYHAVRSVVGHEITQRSVEVITYFEIITYCVSALSLHMKFTDSTIASMICVKSCSI